MSESTGPPPSDTVVVSLLFRGGKAYAAPIGSTMYPEAWKRVRSLEALAEFLQVPFEVEVS